MLRKSTFATIAFVALSGLAGNAFAIDNGGGEVPPSCPGGGVAKGVFHCTGDGIRTVRVCQETAPWRCSVEGGSGSGSAAMGGTSGGHTKPKTGVFGGQTSVFTNGLTVKPVKPSPSKPMLMVPVKPHLMTKN
jgi:hypothetical protein